MTDREFNIYIGELRGSMMRFAITILHHRADAEDVVSGVTERLWRERQRLEAGSRGAAFAMSSVRNACYDLTRQRQRRLREQSDQSANDYYNPEEQRDRVELVRWAMSQLPRREREVLHLKDIEGYTTCEIATIYELEEANIRMILSRSRRAMRDIIVKTVQR